MEASVLDILRSLENWLLVGVMILLGHGGGKVASYCRTPSVVGYLIIGVVLGGSGIGIINADTAHALNLVTDLGLGIVAYIIGSELSGAILRRMGKSLTAILFSQFAATVIIVTVAVWLLAGHVLANPIAALPAALIFGALASATAPAGTVAVIQECKARGAMTRMLLAVVGLDDGLAIMIYAFAAIGAKIALGGGALTAGGVVGGALFEIIGSVAFGAAAGALLSAAVSRTKASGEVLTLTLGTVLLLVGLSKALHMSPILANLAAGMAVANVSSREAERTSSNIGQIVHPAYVVFFCVAGAHLDIAILWKTGLLLAPVYIIARTCGKMGGAYAGAVIGKADPVMRKYLGLGLLPQAGVAVGLALMAAEQFKGMGPAGAELSSLVINTIAATTIFFEIFGPIATKYALIKSGDARIKKEEPDETPAAPPAPDKETGEER